MFTKKLEINPTPTNIFKQNEFYINGAILVGFINSEES